MIDLSTIQNLEPLLNLGLVIAMILGGLMMVVSRFFRIHSDLNRISFVTLVFWIGQLVTSDWRATLEPSLDAIICMASAMLAMFLNGVRPRTERQCLAASIFLAMIIWHFSRTFTEPSEYVTVLNYAVNSMLWYSLPLIVILGGLWDGGFYYWRGYGFFRDTDLDRTVER